MSYVVTGLSPDPFRHLFGLSETALAAAGVIRMTADEKPGFPCRISLEDAEPGETVLLLNHEYQGADTPYRGRHAIFVRESDRPAAHFENEIPEQLCVRLLSVRAFDAQGMMRDADVVEGVDLEPLIQRLLADSQTAYLHVHNARRGCYAARIERAV
ncbi:DUF1203 domain-containing protein [Caulobacter sp. NIBR2454]|uniref:DUF1203 domain-containing protein n=1 Tax=Caulobacter sp. NIBR2454 TaxID=3015996 RepID=UPI0022B751F5|nr:DUF1203 domain-containing protein [Caulobacter sp. NIBR2454]